MYFSDCPSFLICLEIAVCFNLNSSELTETNSGCDGRLKIVSFNNNFNNKSIIIIDFPPKPRSLTPAMLTQQINA